MLIAVDGAPLPLGPVLGKGGEGVVHAIEGAPDLCVKLYAEPASRAAKVRAMVAARLAERHPAVAFPLTIASDGAGAFAGFTMRRVDGALPLHEVTGPGSRQLHFPHADARFLVRVAANIAGAVAAIHADGAVIGDINQSGLLVAPDATVTLIDADSFQVRAGSTVHRCTVGVPEFTPPELMGASLDVERTPQHDAFGLAVVVFQLLFHGRHPFKGVSATADVTVPEAIAAHRFAYSRARNTGLAPPPRMMGLLAVPHLSALFERAFSPGERPDAAAFVRALANHEAALVRCRAVPAHAYDRTLHACPFCQFESATGATLFPPPLSAVPGGADLSALSARVAAIAPLERWAPTPPDLSGEALVVRQRSVLGRRIAQGTSVVGSVLGGFLTYVSPPAFPMMLVMVAFGWQAFSGTLADPARNDLGRVDARLVRAMRAAARTLPLRDARAAKTVAEAAVAAAIEAADGPAREVVAFREAAAREAVAAALAAAPIGRDAGLGLAAVAALRRAGVTSAADVMTGAAARVTALSDGERRTVEAFAHRVAAAASAVTPAPLYTASLAKRRAAAAARARAAAQKARAAVARAEALSDAAQTAIAMADEALAPLWRERAALVREIEGFSERAPAAPVVRV
ncbi:MAG: hypothetical protein AAF318_18220 [Pseudomonadota bacterium]